MDAYLGACLAQTVGQELNGQIQVALDVDYVDALGQLALLVGVDHVLHGEPFGLQRADRGHAEVILVAGAFGLDAGCGQ